MSMNAWGVVLSYVFVFAVIGIAQVILKLKLATPAATRKIVHIGVAHWWLLAMHFFDRWEFAIIGPISFIFINLASYVFRLFPAMEHEQRTKNLGTVYFAIALTINVLLTYAGAIPVWIGGLGIMIMGYGDGLAALFGEHFKGPGYMIYGNRKTFIGSLTMFIASAAVITVFALVWGNPESVRDVVFAVGFTALAATSIEILTPFGLDNITVPILSTLIFYAIW